MEPADGEQETPSTSQKNLVQLHGITLDSSQDGPSGDNPGIPPVENKLASPSRRSGVSSPSKRSVVSFADMEDEETGPGVLANGDPGEEKRGGRAMRSLMDTQGGVVELSSMITNPGMKRAESMEIINSSLHQVNIIFCFFFFYSSVDFFSYFFSTSAN